MRKTLLILSAAFLTWVGVSLYNSTPRAILSRLIRQDRLHSRQLKYRVYFFRVLPVGEAVLVEPAQEEYNGKKVYHLGARARNLDIFSPLVSARAAIDSYVDLKTSNPVAFSQKLSASGRREVQRQIEYDQEKQVMSAQGQRRAILPDTQDPLSATFNLRRMNFNGPKEFEMNINTNQKNYLLKGRAKSEKLTIGKDAYGIVVVKADIQRRNKSPYHKSEMTMVLLKDKENIPLCIDVFNRGISINARLVDTE